MNISDQVLSISLSKKLKELGIKQDSLFYWFDMETHHYLFCKEYEQYSKHVNLDINNGFSAFTVSELGQLLPTVLNISRTIKLDNKEKEINYEYHIKISHFGTSDHWQCSYIGYPVLEGILLHEIGSSAFGENDEKMVDAIAKMVIYLIENNLMIIDDRDAQTKH